MMKRIPGMSGTKKGRGGKGKKGKKGGRVTTAPPSAANTGAASSPSRCRA